MIGFDPVTHRYAGNARLATRHRTIVLIPVIKKSLIAKFSLIFAPLVAYVRISRHASTPERNRPKCTIVPASRCARQKVRRIPGDNPARAS